MTFTGPDGKQYVAIYAGIGGWMGAVAFPRSPDDDPYAALGVVGAMKDIKKYTSPAERCMSSGSKRSSSRGDVRCAVLVACRRAAVAARRHSKRRLSWSCRSDRLPARCSIELDGPPNPFERDHESARRRPAHLRLLQLLGMSRRPWRRRHGSEPSRPRVDLRRLARPHRQLDCAGARLRHALVATRC